MAGLKFYRVRTEDGPQLVHLQAEAKKLDPNFETIEIDTAKQPLMERLNNLMRQANAAPVEEDDETPVVSRPPPPPVKADPSTDRTYDQIGFEEFIWDIPDKEAHRLDILQSIIDERRKEIERQQTKG